MPNITTLGLEAPEMGRLGGCNVAVWLRLGRVQPIFHTQIRHMTELGLVVVLIGPLSPAQYQRKAKFPVVGMDKGPNGPIWGYFSPKKFLSKNPATTP